MHLTNAKATKEQRCCGLWCFFAFNSIWKACFMFILFLQSYWNYGRNEEYIWCEWLSSVVYKLCYTWHRRTSRKSMGILRKTDFNTWPLCCPPSCSHIYISFFQKNNASSDKQLGCFLSVDDIEEVFIWGHISLL